MRKLLKKLNAMREGATLITVVIATAFLIAIGVIILSATTRYLVSVYMDRNSNENLYDAEGILAEVRAGLLEYAGEAGADAYKSVVEDYETVFKNSDGTILSKKERFAQLYLKGIINKLTAPETHTEWDATLQALVNVLPIETEPEGGLPGKSFSVNNIRCLTQVPSAIKTKAIEEMILAGADVSDESTIPQENLDLRLEIYKSPSKGYYLLIKNIVVDYTNDAGYRSSISTDIQLTVPDFKFDGNNTPDEMKKYLIISDGKLSIPKTGLSKKSDGSIGADGQPVPDGAEFSGNIYTGGNIGEAKDANDMLLDDAPGIEIEKDMAARFNCQTLISRGSLHAMTGSHVKIRGMKDVTNGVSTETMDGSVYLKNIKLLPDAETVTGDLEEGDGTVFDMKTDAYIENDLDIQDAGTSVTLGGKYYGYSFSEENGNKKKIKNSAGVEMVDNTLEQSQSDYSSAILINGFGTTLNGDGLSKLELAGRTYVSRGNNITNHNDIMMGESIAVKSNQIAYLLPDEYIHAKHNPVSASDVWTNTSSYYEPESLYSKNDLMANTDLSKYLDPYHPVTANYKQATISGGENYVFLFLNFKDQASANNYFRDFYRGKYLPTESTVTPDDDDEEEKTGVVSPADIRQRAKAYIVSEDGGITLSPSMFLVAGNIIRNRDAQGGSGFQSASYFDGDTPNADLLEMGQDIGVRYVNLQENLTTSGDAKSMRLIPSSRRFLNKELSAQIEDYSPFVGKTISKSGIASVDINKINKGVLEEPNSQAKITVGHSETLMTSNCLGSTGCLLLINDGDVNINAACSGLIIATGKVTVNQNFRGLIISMKDVEVMSSSNLQSDPLLTDSLLEFAKSDPELRKIFGMSSPETHNSTVFEKCCRYMNWEKNEY